MAPIKKIELVDKSYKLVQFQPLTYTLKIGRGNNLLVFDKKEKRQRAIRHCPNEKSIYVDLQSEHAVIEPIIFINGFFNAQSTETSTQKFMDVHPGNGTKFVLVDAGQDAEDLIENEELVMDVKTAIREKIRKEGGIEELRVVVSVLTSDAAGAAKMSVPELKHAAYEAVDTNLNRFVNESGEVTIFDDASIQRQAIAQSAFSSGVIQVSPDATKIIWTDNKAVITLIPAGRGHKDFFADWLSTDDGVQVVQEMTKRMK